MTKEVLSFNQLEISKVCALLADPARVAMLIALSDGVALPAGELAERASIHASTASIHLTKLMEAGWVQVEQHGRHRYYRLTSPEITKLLEQALLVAPTGSVGTSPTERAHMQQHEDIRRARTCYDHLAGKLGVAVTDTLVRRGVLEVGEKEFLLTVYGKGFLQDRGIDVGTVLRQRRALACRCLDWTERREHVGGALGAAICASWLEEGWVQRRDGSRALLITPGGIERLGEWGVESYLTPTREISTCSRPMTIDK